MKKNKNKPALFLVYEIYRYDTCSFFNLIVADTGEILNGWISSSKEFAIYDLVNRHKDKKKEWAKRFGKFDIKFAEDSNANAHEVVSKTIDWLIN